MQEINAELSEEDERTERLAALQAELKRLAKARKTQEQLLEQARKVDASLALSSASWWTCSPASSSQPSSGTASSPNRLATRIQEREAYTQRVARAEEIETAYAAWQSQRAELEHWEEVASALQRT